MNVSDMDSRGEIVIYSAPDGSIHTDVRLESDSFEIEETATCAKLTQVRQEGSRKVNRELLGYNRGQV